MMNILLMILTLLFAGCKAELQTNGTQAADSSKSVGITLDRYVAVNGDTIQVIGTNLSSSLLVFINDDAAPFTLVDAEHGTFVYAHAGADQATITIKLGEKKIAEFPMIDPSLQKDLPQTTATADQLCSDTLARDADGQVFHGTANCADAVKDCNKDGGTDCLTTEDYPFALTDNVSDKIASGETVAGVIGTAPGRVPNCSADGQTDCIVDGTQFRAADPHISTYDLRSGVQLAGVSGNLLLTLPPCASEGQTNCLTSANFPAIDKDRLAQNTSAFLSAQTYLGVTGTLAACAQDGDNGCLVSGSGLAAIETISAAPKILAGQMIGGVTGTGAGRPNDCAADGQTNCVAITAFPALDKAVLTAGLNKISTQISVAGVSGTFPACSSGNQTNCLAVTGYPALDQSKVTASAGSIRSSYTLAGVSGSLTDCAADSQTNCVTVTNFPALDKSGAAAKILAGQTLGGVSGTAAVKPSDCAVDGSVNCVTIGSYPAMNSTGAAAKILTGQSLAGIAGSAPLTPGGCAGDAETGCVASASYPAGDKSHLVAVAASIRNDLTLAGVTGTLADCVADGDTGCVAVGPMFKAAATAGAAAKIISGQTVAGIAGTTAPKPADCNTDGGTGCVTSAAYPAILASGAPAKIVLGQVVGGITGTATNYRPSDCATDGEIGCTTITAFPTLNAATAAAKIAAGDSLGGVAGTAAVRPSDCGAEGSVNCVAITNYPTVDTTALNAQKALFKSDLTIAGVTGTMVDCSSDGMTDCEAAAAYPATIASSVAAKVLTGSTLAGVSGTAPVRPADCSADGNTACVTTTNYPAIDKTTVIASSLRSGLTLGGVPGTIGDCSADGSTNCVTVAGYVAANSTGAPAKILTGQSVAGISGSALGKPSDCSADGVTNCVAVTAYPAISTTNLNSVKAQYQTSLTIGSVAGTLADCATDGTTTCVTNASYPSMNSSLAAAKIASGSTLGGIAGTAAIKPSNCASDGGTNCTTVANYISIDSTALAGKAPKFRAATSLAGVTGTLADCSSDGSSGCVALAAYPAMVVSGAAAKIRSGQTLGGVAGSALLPPSNCATDNTTNCISQSAYPAVDLTALTAKAAKFTNMTLDAVAGTLANCSTDNSFGCITLNTNPAADATNLTAGNIKNGTTFGGVTGAYPSSTYKLTDASGTGLTSSNFVSSLQSASTFEYFTSAGVRNTGTGSASFVSSNLRTSIFGIAPTYGPNCATDLQTSCVTQTNYPALQVSTLIPWNYTRGTYIGGVEGKINRAKSAAMLSRWNVTTDAGSSSSTTVADFNDTIDDDIHVSGTAYPTDVPAWTGWTISAVNDIIIRDPATDTNHNGLCDAGEICQFYDQNTQRYWNRFDTNSGNWEQAVNACVANSSSSNASPATGWRLATQKEYMQAYIDGIAAKTAEIVIPNAFYWTSTTQSDNPSYAAHMFHPNNGHAKLSAKTAGAGFLCTYP